MVIAEREIEEWLSEFEFSDLNDFLSELKNTISVIRRRIPGWSDGVYISSGKSSKLVLYPVKVSKFRSMEYYRKLSWAPIKVDLEVRDPIFNLLVDNIILKTSIGTIMEKKITGEYEVYYTIPVRRLSDFLARISTESFRFTYKEDIDAIRTIGRILKEREE
ncbi:MAG: hypothetical protein DRP01_11430 [Archaeoglobales archaeon]|nr:MAG: hypothetical protein DRP01_11430 [Archaeoglobales archaeon]